MATAAVEEHCACGAEFAMSYTLEEGDNAHSPADTLMVLNAVREWRTAHTGHAERRLAATDRPGDRPAMGFNTTAISGDFNSGEDDGWQGLWAGPGLDDFGDDDDDEDA